MWALFQGKRELRGYPLNPGVSLSKDMQFMESGGEPESLTTVHGNTATCPFVNPESRGPTILLIVSPGHVFFSL